MGSIDRLAGRLGEARRTVVSFWFGLSETPTETPAAETRRGWGDWVDDELMSLTESHRDHLRRLSSLLSSLVFLVYSLSSVYFFSSLRFGPLGGWD